jgi:hypothetical protein
VNRIPTTKPLTALNGAQLVETTSAARGAKAAIRLGMYQHIEFAGFAAAQVVCCLFDRQPFLPLAFSRRAPDRKTVSMLAGGSPEIIAARGQQWLDGNPDEADEAVVAVDGYVTIVSGRKDAILLDLRSYRVPATRMRMAVPYRPHHDAEGFAVHRPEFIVAALAGQDTTAMTKAFFQGVFSHDYGGRIWQQCADQSW